MITFDDIKTVYSSTSDSEINRTYTERQKENIRLNNEIAKDVFFEFPNEILTIPSDMSDSEKVSYLISLFLNSGNKRLIKIVLEILKKYNYNASSELLKTMQRTDYYFNGDINFITYSKFIYGAISIKNIEGASLQKVILKSSYGNINLYPLDTCFNMGKIDTPKKRRRFCHNLTSDILAFNPDLYGAYYYIPFEFKGYMEHSVLLDLNHELVLDFANNIVIPLKTWERFYNNPSILIKGKEFRELSKRCNDELGLYLTTCTLDSVRRIRKKTI